MTTLPDQNTLDFAQSVLGTHEAVERLHARARDERAYTFRALTAARQQALHLSGFDVARHRYIILSDTHKGNRRPGSDEFIPNEQVYCHALTHYLDNDYRLVLNGDIEEGWKAGYGDIIDAYRDTAFALEREFAAKGDDYYVRIFGNHDIDWADPRFVKKYLDPFFGRPMRVHPGLVLGSRLFVVHGHQGDLCSDRLTWLSRRIIRHVWRPLQNLTSIHINRAAANHFIRDNRDRFISAWGRINHLLVIAGHTHRALMHPFQPPKNEDDCGLRHYVNDGCCVHTDGMTAIEIDQGAIRLVRWRTNDGVGRSVFGEYDLGQMLARL